MASHRANLSTKSVDIFSHFHRNAKKISAAGFVCADCVFHFVFHFFFFVAAISTHLFPSICYSYHFAEWRKNPLIHTHFLKTLVFHWNSFTFFCWKVKSGWNEKPKKKKHKRKKIIFAEKKCSLNRCTNIEVHTGQICFTFVRAAINNFANAWIPFYFQFYAKLFFFTATPTIFGFVWNAGLFYKFILHEGIRCATEKKKSK